VTLSLVLIVAVVSSPVLVPDAEPVPVAYVPAACLPLNVLQSAELNAPLFAADAVGMFSVMAGVVVLLATLEVTSVPVVPRVKAATEVTVPVFVVNPDGLVAAYAPKLVNAPAAVVAFVPPEVTAKVVDKPAAVPEVLWLRVGNVQFARLPEVGVPRTGVTSDGLVNVGALAKTTEPPEPVRVAKSV